MQAASSPTRRFTLTSLFWPHRVLVADCIKMAMVVVMVVLLGAGFEPDPDQQVWFTRYVRNLVICPEAKH
jgi:hypothetical protein